MLRFTLTLIKSKLGHSIIPLISIRFILTTVKKKKTAKDSKTNNCNNFYVVMVSVFRKDLSSCISLGFFIFKIQLKAN